MLNTNKHNLPLRTIPYSRYETGLPQQGHCVLGQETGESIIVYQAFNDRIADFALSHQQFGGEAYSFSRMTWIKPNFLWMMYRSGWASKPGQERILAIRMSKSGFLSLLELGVYSGFQADKYPTRENWQSALRQSDVRIQWDPDHLPKGGKHERRAIQIGIKGRMLHTFNQQFIREITDITPFVVEQREKLAIDFQSLEVIEERVISLQPALREKYGSL